MKSLNYFEKTKQTKTTNQVTHLKAEGIVTNDNKTKTKQKINLFVQGEKTFVATWSAFVNGRYQRETVLEIAKNFNSFYPEFEVLAAVNGDYFYLNTKRDLTVNANVIFGNRVLKHYNHDKYYALELNQFGQKEKLLKSLKEVPDLTLTIYDNQKKVCHKALLDGQTKIVKRSDFKKHLNNKSFYLQPMMLSDDKDCFFLEGTIKKANFKTVQYALVSQDSKIVELLNNCLKVKLQFELKEIQPQNNLIGIDTKLISGNKILKFSQMSGQDQDHNQNRHPRTSLGYNKEGKLILCTVDGRTDEFSGVDLRELAKILNYYQIVEAYNLDGGASTQAVYKVGDKLKLVNEPSAKPLRKVANAILFFEIKT